MPVMRSLINKYNVPGPRYTSYPTVPFWDDKPFTVHEWVSQARRTLTESSATDGASVYIHLPFCETPCTFCGCIKRFTRNHGVEQPYVDTLIHEWMLYGQHLGVAPPVKEIHIGGGTPTFFAPENLSRLMDAIVEHARISPPFDFSFEGNPSTTSAQHLKVMRAHGFRRLSLGVQDFDPIVQKTINRIQTFEQVAQVTDTARQLDYTSINFDLIYGLPRQRLAGIVETMNKVVSLRPDRISFYGYAHVPWVPEASQRRFSESEIPRGEQKRALYDIGRDLLLEAGYHEIGMDHFALETDALFRSASTRSLHRNFMGYTPWHTRLCIGLGISAISDAWYAFAQNTKSLESYQQQINAGELAIFRGHKLTEEDLVLRRLILQIMCHHETRLDAAFSALDCASECLQRLSELINDHVVALDGDRLLVTESGRPFVRNVCMAFDARLWRERTHTVMFSDTI